MARRNRVPKIKEGIYRDALPHVTQLEERMMKATVPVTFTVEDVIDTLWSPDVLAILRKAYPYAETAGSDLYTRDMQLIPEGNWIAVRVDMTARKMLVPAPEVHTQLWDIPADNPMIKALQALCDIHDKFEDIRYLIDWMNAENVTAGAARNYFPSIAALLPQNHAIHTVKPGGGFKEPKNLAPQLPYLRQAGNTIARALLCGEPPPQTSRDFQIGFYRRGMDATFNTPTFRVDLL